VVKVGKLQRSLSLSQRGMSCSAHCTIAVALTSGGHCAQAKRARRRVQIHDDVFWDLCLEDVFGTCVVGKG
jgi:hypothetical protein